VVPPSAVSTSRPRPGRGAEARARAPAGAPCGLRPAWRAVIGAKGSVHVTERALGWAAQAAGAPSLVGGALLTWKAPPLGASRLARFAVALQALVHIGRPHFRCPLSAAAPHGQSSTRIFEVLGSEAPIRALCLIVKDEPRTSHVAGGSARPRGRDDSLSYTGSTDGLCGRIAERLAPGGALRVDRRLRSPAPARKPLRACTAKPGLWPLCLLDADVGCVEVPPATCKRW